MEQENLLQPKCNDDETSFTSLQVSCRLQLSAVRHVLPAGRYSAAWIIGCNATDAYIIFLGGGTLTLNSPVMDHVCVTGTLEHYQNTSDSLFLLLCVSCSFLVVFLYRELM